MATMPNPQSKSVPKPGPALRAESAEQLIRRVGARLTSPRSAVLTLLQSSDHALSHQEVTDILAGQLHVDRVTVYRVLDWLVEQGLAHRISGEDRVWRFSMSRPAINAARSGKSGAEAHRHAHFACKQCGQTFCLESIPAALDVKLPAGYRPEAVELTIRGLCGHCK